MGNLPRSRPSSQLLLLDLSNRPGRIPRHDRIRWNTPGDDHYRFGYFPAPDPRFRLKEMGGGIDLDDRADRDLVANVQLIAVQNGTQDIQTDMIADMNVLTVTTVDGWQYDRILADLSEKLLEDGLSFRRGFGQIVEPE
jgi:hypothetical protein